jgi:hypothetical protein
VHVDSKFYKHLDYGYAATVHKAQGTTVDRSYVLATTHFDRHTAYVSLSRHRDNATVFYARDDFGGRVKDATDDTVRQRFTETLSCARPKELAHDYLERDAKVDSPLVADLVVEQWRKHHNTPTPSQPSASNANDLDARQQAAAERWAAGQQNAPQPTRDGNRELNRDHSSHPENENTPERTYNGPEDELER